MSNDGASAHTDLGFWGITVGGNYAYSRHYSVSVQAGTAINFPLPFPAPLDRFGDTVSNRNAGSSFINVQHRINFCHFDVGYGLAVATAKNKETLYIRTAAMRDMVPVYNYSDVRLSASLSAYYRLSDNWYTGVLYQPGIFTSTGTTILNSGHFITLDLQWRFRL